MLCTRFHPGGDAMRVYAQIWAIRSVSESTFQTETEVIIQMYIGLALQKDLQHSADVRDVSHSALIYFYNGYSPYSRAELRVRLWSLPLLGHFIFSFLFCIWQSSSWRITRINWHSCENKTTRA